MVHLQWSSAYYKWYSTPPLVSLSVMVNTSTSHRFFATSSIGCQCLRGYSSKLLHWRLTVSEALGLPTSAALSAQSLTILAVLVSARLSMVICSFHEPEQLGSVGGAFSSQLQMSGTHCRFTFVPRPSVAGSFKQGSRLIFSGWPFTDFFSENYWRDWTELNWTAESVGKWSQQRPTTGIRIMIAKTGNGDISGNMTHDVEILTANSELSTTKSSIKVSPSDCDNDRQPEMARLAPKRRYSNFRSHMGTLSSCLP